MSGFGIVDFIVGKQNTTHFTNGLAKVCCPFTLIYVYALAAKGQLCNPDTDLNLIIYNMQFLIMINLKQELNWLVAFIYVNHDVIIQRV